MFRSPTCYLSHRLVGRKIPDRGGRGVFARVFVPAGSVVAAWGGEVVTRDWLRRRGPDVLRVSLQIDDNLFLVSGREGPADWINHSCDPNAGLRGQVVLVAMRDIEPGEEVCYDYAMTDASEYDTIECACGSPHCRGRITGRDWRKPEIARRYDGFFSPYIQARIDRRRAAQTRAVSAG